MLVHMILDILTRPAIRKPIFKALENASQGEENGTSGEDRLVLSGLSWERYLEVDEALGHDRPDPRMYYLNGELEIMTTSVLHQKLKKWLGDLIGDYLFETGLEAFPRGQATMRILKEAGAEPDESWCLSEDKEFPDIVLEIALTSGGIAKLDVYRPFAVREVWLWRKGAMEIWSLRRNGPSYDGPAKKSRLLPGLDFRWLTRCLGLPSWREARRVFRDSLGKTRRSRWIGLERELLRSAPNFVH
jgi:Uma2 family endonuclease